MIWRAAPEPLVVTPEWWLPAPPPRPVPDYVGGEEHIDYLADPDSDRPIEYL